MNVIIDTGETVFIDSTDVAIGDFVMGFVVDFAGVTDNEIVGEVVGLKA